MVLPHVPTPQRRPSCIVLQNVPEEHQHHDQHDRDDYTDAGQELASPPHAFPLQPEGLLLIRQRACVRFDLLPLQVPNLLEHPGQAVLIHLCGSCASVASARLAAGPLPAYANATPRSSTADAEESSQAETVRSPIFDLSPAYAGHARAAARYSPGRPIAMMRSG